MQLRRMQIFVPALSFQPLIRRCGNKRHKFRDENFTKKHHITFWFITPRQSRPGGTHKNGHFVAWKLERSIRRGFPGCLAHLPVHQNKFRSRLHKAR